MPVRRRKYSRLAAGVSEGAKSLRDVLSFMLQRNYGQQIGQENARAQQQLTQENAQLQDLLLRRRERDTAVSKGEIDPDQAMGAPPSMARRVSGIMAGIDEADDPTKLPTFPGLSESAKAARVPLINYGETADLEGDDDTLPSRQYGPVDSPEFGRIRSALSAKQDQLRKAVKPERAREYDPDLGADIDVERQFDPIAGVYNPILQTQAEPTGAQRGRSEGQAALAELQTPGLTAAEIAKANETERGTRGEKVTTAAASSAATTQARMDVEFAPGNVNRRVAATVQQLGAELQTRQDFERLSGLTDLSLGRQPNRVGATRTAKGTQTLLSEAGLRLKMALEGFQRFWIGVFSDILALDQEYLPPEQEFRVTGQRPTVMRVKDRTELRGQYDLRLATTVDQLNRDQMRQDATVLLQALMNPVAVQLGLVGQKGFRRAYADLLKSFGKNPDFYLEEQSAIRTPEEELMLFTVDQYVGPVMGENIMHHLQTHEAQAQDPVLPPATRSLLARHLQETMQLARLMQAQQGMLGPGGNGSRPPMGPGMAGPAGGQQAVNAEAGRAPQPLNTSPGQGGGMPYGG